MDLELLQHELIDELHAIAKERDHELHELSLGFFAYQDTMASEMISLCLRHELRVPENVAVLGVDNDDLINSGLTLGMSSVDSDQEGLGSGAGGMNKGGLMATPKKKAKRQYRKGGLANKK